MEMPQHHASEVLIARLLECESRWEGNVNFLQRLMTYGHCFPLYLGTENSSRTGDVSGERGAHGKQDALARSLFSVVHRDV